MTITAPERDRTREGLLPRGVVVAAAFITAAVLIIMALLGPLVLGIIRYRTSPSGVWQTMGVDLVNLLLIAPILLIGSLLLIARREAAKYFLILTPVTLFSLAVEGGMGQEWGNPAYTGNVEEYAWLFIVEVIGALILLVGVLPMFAEADAPRFGRRGLRIYVAFVTLLLVLFAAMWVSEVMQVATTGDTASGSYVASPVAFWAVRIMDLGLSIPLGFLGMYLLLRRPERAYALVLLFFGFFMTTGTSVNTMALVMVLNHDPSVQAGSLVIFPLLGIMAWAGLLYLLKDKLPWSRHAKEIRGRVVEPTRAK